MYLICVQIKFYVEQDVAFIIYIGIDISKTVSKILRMNAEPTFNFKYFFFKYIKNILMFQNIHHFLKILVRTYNLLKRIHFLNIIHTNY